MSDRNPLKNLLKRVLKRELVTKHGARAVYSHLLQNKQYHLQNKQQSKSGGSQASHHCHTSKVVQQKQQETNASSKSVDIHHQQKHHQHHKQTQCVYSLCDCVSSPVVAMLAHRSLPPAGSITQHTHCCIRWGAARIRFSFGI